MPDVLITGLGAIGPLGGNVPDTWAAALRAVSGIRQLPAAMVDEYALPVSFAGVAAIEPAEKLTKPELNRMDRATQFALIAAREAWRDAGFVGAGGGGAGGGGAGGGAAGAAAGGGSADAAKSASQGVEPSRLAVSVSSALGGITTTLGAWDTMQSRGVRRVLPLTIPMLMPNAAAAVLALEFDAQAGAHAPTSACAAGAEAIAYGYQLIKGGQADVVIAGGTEAPIHPLVIGAFAAARALTTRNDSPARASRPFALHRDGFVLSEGAGIVILESEPHARARGATGYARLAGAGITSDAYHLTAPEPDGRGQISAMRAAIRGADAHPSDVRHINPHATSTPLGDGVEARAIAEVLGGATDAALVSATKSLTGHLLGGAGGLEAVLAVLAIAHRMAPPTINTGGDLDPDIPLALVLDKPSALPAGDLLALSNSFGFGGHNVSLAFAPC